LKGAQFYVCVYQPCWGRVSVRVFVWETAILLTYLYLISKLFKNTKGYAWYKTGKIMPMYRRGPGRTLGRKC
jgi:hypothetical protein